MSILDRIFRKKNKAETSGTLVGEDADTLMEWLGIRGKKEEISEVTYFTCLKKLAEAMGKLPLKYYQETEEGKKRIAIAPGAGS